VSMEQHGGAGKATIELLPKVNEYLGLVMTLIFAFGLVFQMPVVLTLLARAGLVSSDTLKTKRKYAIVLTFIAAAVLTPPDPISQLGLAIPTLLLYEVSIQAVRLVEARRREREAAEEAA
jgi:sec-independent protein translocase protein TatC